MQTDLPKLSLVVPVYNEESSLPELRRRIDLIRDELPAALDVLLVDDGSFDDSLAVATQWCRADRSVTCISLSRNFGEQAAISAGLDNATGDFVVIIPADLQDPPELIPVMLAAAMGGADVVYTRRIGRDEGLIKRSLATAFYSIMERLARTPYQGQAGDFKLLSRRVVDSIKAMPERRRFVRGMVSFVGFEQVPVDYRRADRAEGRGVSYVGLFKLAAEAITAYSDVPLSLATLIGSVIAFCAVVSALTLAVLSLVGVLSPSLLLLILIVVALLGGIQLIAIGILGTYVARVHEQTLGRPLYLIGSVVTGAYEDSNA